MSTIASLASTYAASAPSVTSEASPVSSPNQKMGNLFDQIDSSGSGSITKGQLEQAFTTQNPPSAFQTLGADSLYSQLDPSGTGSVSKQDFVSGMADVREQFRQGNLTSPSQSIDAASQSLDSLTSNSGSTFAITV